MLFRSPNTFRVGLALWPGSTAAWTYGSSRGLLIAWAFGLLLCIGWISTAIWPAWIGDWEWGLLWACIAISSLFSACYQTWYARTASARTPTGCSDDELREAQSLYLRGSYFEAEEILLPFCSGLGGASAGLRSTRTGVASSRNNSLRNKPSRATPKGQLGGGFDIEAALWLAMIYRRTGRYDAALLLLQKLELLELGAVWSQEIEQEKEKIVSGKART